MSGLTRRQVLGRALLAGAGATVVQGLPDGRGSGPAEAATDPETDPNFLMGQVVSFDSATGAVQVVDLDLQVRAAQFISSSQIWKQGLWNTNQLALNDCVMSRGQLDSSGVLMINELYVGIRSFQGVLDSVSASSVTLTQPDGSIITAGVTGLTEVNVDGQTQTGTTQGLAPTQYVNLIGYGDPSAGTLVATLIIGPTPDSGLDTSPPVVNSGGFTTYSHSATWFCCGNISSACGADCANSGGGSCGTCRADKIQMAWPNLYTTGCNSTCGCGGNCCRSGFCALGCGRIAIVYNPCRNHPGATATITDCGPCVHCVSPPCKGLAAVTFDLTPCTFTALGALLSDGIQACVAAVTCPS
jgi:hypothetical protein